MITAVLILINIVVGFISFADSSVIYNYGIIPALVQSGEWFRLVTSMFVHTGIIHLASNMGALLSFGPELEKELGSLKFLGLYLLSGLGGGLLVLYMSSNNTCTVGASGAIFGLMGALYLLHKNFGNRRQLGVIGQNIAVNLYYTFAEETISIGGHIGGLITGLIVGSFLVKTKHKKSSFVGIIAVIFCVVCFFGGNASFSNHKKPINSISMYDNMSIKAVPNERTLNGPVINSEYVSNQNITNVKTIH